MKDLCYNCFQEKPGEGPCPHCGYDNAEPAGKYPLALKQGAILNGRYTIGRVLGQGGFGITYLAQDFHTKERVAIKEYLPTEFVGRTQGTYAVQVYSGDRQENFEYGKAQFLNEAKTLAQVQGNEHIVRVYRYFEENNTAYFVMEYVDGPNLAQYMKEKGDRLSTEEACRLLLPVMDALDGVHKKGIVHRDIAPDNILIGKDGTAKILDFGAARYSTGEKSKSLDVILKHGFAPKEQYQRRGRQGPFTDVYAMAATFYYAITGKTPPDAIDRMEDDSLIPPSTLGAKLSDQTEEVLYKAMEVNASARYQSIGQFADALKGTVLGNVEPAPTEASVLPPEPNHLNTPLQTAASEKKTGQDPVSQTAGIANKTPFSKKHAKFIGIIAALFIVVLIGMTVSRTLRAKDAADLSTTQEASRQEAATQSSQNAYSTASVGDTIYFGAYEQDNHQNEKEKIEWLVLAKEGNRLLVISRYGLNAKPFSGTDGTTWETSTLRSWLNGTFLNAAFSSAEKEMIPIVSVSADQNPYVETDPGNATQDQVFLLSVSEAEQYFRYNAERQCKATPYAIAQGCSARAGNSICTWWLRTPCSDQDRPRAACVSTDGHIDNISGYVGNTTIAIRPALWISLAS